LFLITFLAARLSPAGDFVGMLERLHRSSGVLSSSNSGLFERTARADINKLFTAYEECLRATDGFRYRKRNFGDNSLDLLLPTGQLKPQAEYWSPKEQAGQRTQLFM